jgi:hypothetical protein
LGKEYVEDILAQGDPAWEAPEDLHTQSVVELRVGAFTVSGMFRLLSPTQTTPKSCCIKSCPTSSRVRRRTLWLTPRHRRIHLRLATERYSQMGHHCPLCPSWRPHPGQDISTR